MDSIAIIAILVGGGGVLALLRWIQDNAKAHTDVEALQRDISDMKDRERENTTRIAKLEERVDQMGKDNSHLTEQNTAIIRDNSRLIEQNGQLIAMIQGGDDEETTEDPE